MIQRSRPLAFAFLAAGLWACAGEAKAITYAGKDAEILKCAAMIGAGTQAGHLTGQISPGEYKMGMALLEIYLERLPGTPRQKRGALETMLRRLLQGRSPEAIKRDFDQFAPRCERLLQDR